MALKDAMAGLLNGLAGKKSEIIDTQVIIDEQFPAEMIAELSNGKGDEE